MTVRSGKESTTAGTHVKKQVSKAPPTSEEDSGDALDKNRSAASPRPAVRVADQLKPGKLFVCFELQRELSDESTGAVWLAQDYSVRRHSDQAALKFLPDLIVNNKFAVDELKNELRQKVALQHSNIQRVYGLIENRGILALQLEYVDGHSLSQLRLRRPHQVFEAKDLEIWVKELCHALMYAHEQVGMADGEITPQNLIVDSLGNLKLKEFGITSCIAATMSRLAAVNDPGETLCYTSPQRAAGGSPSIADDLYSLGATLYELLTGKPPFYTGDIRAQVSGSIPPSMMERRAELGIEGGAIPQNWEETVAACLAKDPAQRPQSATEVERRLKTPTEVFVEPPPPVPFPPLQKPWLVIAGIAMLVLVSVVAFYPLQHVTETKTGRSNLITNPDSGRSENFLAKPTPSREMSAKTAPAISPTPYAEVEPTPAPELNPTPSGALSPTPVPEVKTKSSPEVTPTPSPVLSPAPSGQEVAAAKERQAASSSPTPLSQNAIDATKEDVIKRINALPGVTAEKKAVLIDKMNKARFMERLAVIPFDAGQTILRRAAADELVKAFSRPEMREKLSDPTVVLVVAGYADNGGRADKNLHISQERAEDVSKVLKEQAALMNAMQVIGMGATELLSSERPNQNRAVEVWMVVPL